VIRSVLDSLATPTVPSVAESVKLALAQRSDGIAARREVEASAKRSAQARSQRLPRLDLIASSGYGGTSSASRFLTYGDSTDVRSSSWTLGLSASVFGRNDAASAADQRAEAAFESARVAGSAVDNAIVSDVRAAVRALSTERDRYLRARDVVRLAEREYAVAQEGARLGLITTFQLLQYEDQLSQARLLDAQARFALQDAGTLYRLAVGSVRSSYGDVARQR
jgi:outer membrane protein TolC